MSLITGPVVVLTFLQIFLMLFLLVIPSSAQSCTQCLAKREGLVHYPTTLAPHFGVITVSTECADNAALATGSSLSVRCSSSGSWTGTTPQCECDTGYHAVTVSGRQICQNSTLCADDGCPTLAPCPDNVVCQARSVGLVRYPTTL
ncbi:hypothetical protein GBAR_LOCUS14067, partial [Geodia barretti]